MAKERQRLNLDLEQLFPGDTLTIGSSVIHIRPLGVLQLSTITNKLKGFLSNIQEEGITWSNFKEPENMFKVAATIVGQAPEILAEAANVELEDIQALPLEVNVMILDKVIEVNMKSKEALEGNFKSLAAKFGGILQEKKSRSPKQSKS